MALDTIRHDTQWIVERTIASGGMGTVCQARQLGSAGFEKRVALKVLKEGVSTDELYRQQLVDEARLCANLVHENIVQIYQLLIDEGRYVVVMELCDGVTLRQFLARHEAKQRRVPVDLAVFIASRVCRALEYAHTLCDPSGRPLGIVHRDICPNNIMITLGGVVKLGDFGIAKASFIPNQEGQILQGKARYMSPEQANFEVTDGRSDLFSLGIVLHETLAGRPLFRDESTVRTILNVRTKPVPPLTEFRDDVPEQLEAILECALARDPARRFQDAASLGYQLEFYLYHDRYGPTNQKLREYIEELFPELYEVGGTAAQQVAVEKTRPHLPPQGPLPGDMPLQVQLGQTTKLPLADIERRAREQRGGGP